MHEASRAFTSLTDHRHYRYRGCAPDPDQPTQAQGDVELSIDAWSPSTRDGGEEQAARLEREKAATAVCAACPVLEACRAYGLALGPDGRLLAEPEGIWGGMTSLARHRDLIERRRQDAAWQEELAEQARRRAVREASTPQKQAVLVALARETDERMVAYRADMDVRTANWHRASLVGLLGLDRETATRRQLLNAARRLGVLGPIPVRRDGRWRIIAAPNTEGTRQRRLAPGMPVRKGAGEVPVQLVVPGYEHLPRTWPTPTPTPASAAVGGRRQLRIVAPLAEQLALPLHLPVPAPLLEPAA